MEKENPDTSVKPGGLHVVLDIMNEVERVVTEELEVHPRFPDLHNRLGLIKLSKGDFDAARASFEASVALNNYYLAAKVNLGFALMELGRVEESEATFNKALENEVHPLVLAAMGCLRMKQARFADAEAVLSEARTLESKNALFPHHTAIAQFLRGGFVEAQASLCEAERLCPPYSEVFAEALLFVEGRLSREAFRNYIDKHEMNPFLSELHDHLGHAYSANGMFQEAEAEYRLSLKAMPSLANYYGNLALVHSAQDREHEALLYLLKAVDAEPRSVKARIALAFEYSARGLAQDAMKQFEAARDLRPDYPDVRYNLSLIYIDLGRLDDAIVELKAALRSNPSYLFARNSFAYTLFRKGEHEEALAQYRRVVAAGLCSADMLVNMGIIYKERGALKKAIDTLNKAISINPSYAPAYYQLGLAYQARGQKEKARWAWKAYLQKAQDDAEVEDIKRNMTDT